MLEGTDVDGGSLRARDAGRIGGRRIVDHAAVDRRRAVAQREVAGGGIREQLVAGDERGRIAAAARAPGVESDPVPSTENIPTTAL